MVGFPGTPFGLANLSRQISWALELPSGTGLARRASKASKGALAYGAATNIHMYAEPTGCPKGYSIALGCIAPRYEQPRDAAKPALMPPKVLQPERPSGRAAAERARYGRRRRSLA